MFHKFLKSNHLSVLSSQINVIKNKKQSNMFHVSSDNFIKINVETNNGDFLELKVNIMILYMILPNEIIQLNHKF